MIREQELRFLQTIALCGLERLAGERTPQSFYHVLRGRVASQTHQDVHIFRLHPYYRLFPRLSKERWQEILQSIAQAGLIVIQPLARQSGKETAVLTEAGRSCLRAGRDAFQLADWLDSLDGIALSRSLEEFWLRFHLIVQTVSHLLHGERGFSPIVQHHRVQEWVKRTLGTGKTRACWLDGLRQELAALLEPFPEPLQRLVVEQLSGAGQAGKTLEQIACDTGEPPSLLRVKTIWCLNQMMRQLSQAEPGRFPLLGVLVEDGANGGTPLSHSARVTGQLLRQGLSIEEVAARRRLKVSTVEDHLVEIALHCADWDWSTYITPEEQRAVVRAAKQLATRRLRVIKDHLGDGYTYLKIRLALAIGGGSA